MDFLIRPIKKSDLDAVFQLAKETGPGMTSLPADKALLAKKIQESENAFKIDPLGPGSESYRLVMEVNSEIVGIAGIRAKIGGFEPFYSYETKYARHSSPSLKVDKEIPYLELSQEYNGPTIIGSLFLSPKTRGHGLGAYLSYSRFMFMADHPERFSNEVIAEMRGVINENGKSPFWEATVRHFFNIAYDEADYLSSKDKGFIADLMPKYPIYIPLLRDEAIEVIGEVHKHTKPALKYLMEEGFKKDTHVDIFDAGPRVICETKNIRTIKESKKVKISSLLKNKSEIAALSKVLISNSKIDFKLSTAEIEIHGEEISLLESDLNKLGVNIGDYVRIRESIK